MFIEDILEKFGITATEALVNAIKTKLIERQGASGGFKSVVNASGRLADSIDYVVTGSRLTIRGNDYIYYLENGRKPTKGGGNGQLKVAIRQWIDDKGIVPKDGISKDSLAFLITRRIHREGTTIYKAGGSDLVSGIFNDQFVDSLQSEFMNLLTVEIESEILKLVA
jgi:hypothetical protein